MEQQIFLQRIKDIVLSIDKDAKVILYGSRARGDNRNDSDWDFLVITKKNTNDSLKRLIRKGLVNIELESGQSISMYGKHFGEWENKHRITPLYKNVQKEGIFL
mgnify:CR=1 FL=1